MQTCFRRAGLMLAHPQIHHLLQGTLLSFPGAFGFWLNCSIFEALLLIIICLGFVGPYIIAFDPQKHMLGVYYYLHFQISNQG